LESRFPELPVIPTVNNIRYHFGTCFQRVNKKMCDPLFNVMFVVFVGHTNGHMILPRANLQHDLLIFSHKNKIALYWFYAKIKNVK